MILVKICGITNWPDAKAACDAGANMLGFNFYEKSLRRVSTVEAATMRAKLPQGIQAVGLFVNAKPAEIQSLHAFVRFTAAQLHGDEPPAIVSEVSRTVPVIKAFRVAADFPPSTLDKYHDAFAFLLDGSRAGQFGGTGANADWNVARRAAVAHRIILAGGLTPENVGAAIRSVRPYAVDVAGGVESKPGRKDHARMKAFIDEVRRAEEQLQESDAPQTGHPCTMSSTISSATFAPGRFGPYGGRYVPETLMVPLFELERAYEAVKTDAKFQAEFADLLKNFAGRPTPLQFASRLTAHLGGPRIYLKREDLLHTGAHKINNAIGQGLLAVKMGKPRIIAETGAGQHGVASATVAAHLGLECVVYMGTEDMARQALNVSRMRMLGTRVVGVNSGSRTLKDAINEAMRDWVTNVRNTHYLLGSVLGAHPYPTMVRDFQSVIGREAREQILAAEKCLPTHLFACVGGGSNAIGLFHQFLRDGSVKMVGIEAGGRGGQLGEHAARLAAHQGFTGARPGVLQGTYTYILQNEDGQIATTHSISAGLDYPAIGPEHAWLADEGRAEYSAVSDSAALEAARLLSRIEGIIPALESAHAIAGLIERAPKMSADDLVILNLSGRGDKDMDTYSRLL